MIYDHLENLPSYAKMSPEVWEKLITFLDKCGKGEIGEGRHELEGDKLYVNVMSYNTKPFNENMLEYHKRYIDIQLLLAGNETIYYAPKGAEVSKPYDDANDCGFNKVPADALPLPLEVGNFVMLLPEEGHLPGVGEDTPVVKAVVKMAAELID